GTALTVDSQEGQVITFKPVSVTMLVDSPLLAGARLREIDITSPGETRIHKLDLAAESAAALDIPKDVIASYRRLVAETGALFKARHYEHYNFLVWLHGMYQDGLEHHQSSDNRLPEMGLADAQWRRIQGDLLGHEMVHSWNGKYRRPAGLATPNYQAPMKGDLLWVYEGLTNYLGQVLAARSGLWTPDDYRDRLALSQLSSITVPAAPGGHYRIRLCRRPSSTEVHRNGRPGGEAQTFTGKEVCCGWKWILSFEPRVRARRRWMIFAGYLKVGKAVRQL